jgi:hypothetical protein
MASGRLDTGEIFVGDIQHSTRLCAPLHCCFVLQPLFPLAHKSIDTVMSAVKNKFSLSSDMSIHPSTEEKINVSFPKHEAAILALRAANQGRDLFIDSVPYSFQLNHTVCQKQIIKNKYNDSARRAAAPSFASLN